jgi:DNA-binding CsgD family transcriptional regulator
MESDLPPDPALLTKAAHARQSWEISGWPKNSLGLRSLPAADSSRGCCWATRCTGLARPRAAEAETELAAVAALARTDTERVQAAIPRSANLVYGLNRPAEARSLLDTVMKTLSDDVAALELSAMRSVFDAFGGRTVEAAEGAVAVLAHPSCPPPAAQLATWGLAAARGSQGHLGGLAERIGWIDARADAFEVGLHQAAIIGSAWVHGLLLAGLLDTAEKAARRYRERCEGATGFGYSTISTMCAAVAQARGQLHTAARWFSQALAAGEPPFMLPVDLHGALGMAGDATSAGDAWQRMAHTVQRPGYTHVKPELQLGAAWVAAAEGSVSEAIALCRQAGQLAAAQQQPAVEVVALHTAVCFGGPHGRRSAHQVGRPGRRLPRTRRRRARRCCAPRPRSARLRPLRQQPRAPAGAGLRRRPHAALAAPLPLTVREREIVTLAAGGLSNRQIADRLVVSVRTVEGHLYRPCAKHGVSDRNELAPLVHGD